MNELVSRQVAIEYLMANMKWFNEDGYESDDDYKRECITDLINGVPPAQPGWIPCSERLPYVEYGESDYVLTTCGYRNVKDTRVRWIKFLYFNGGNWCYPTGETYEGKVYAWMPLPEPYKGGTE